MLDIYDECDYTLANRLDTEEGLHGEIVVCAGVPETGFFTRVKRPILILLGPEVCCTPSCDIIPNHSKMSIT